MSAAAFDNLDRKIRLMEAKKTLKIWQDARSRSDLTERDVEFLDRCIAGTKLTIEDIKGEGWWQ